MGLRGSRSLFRLLAGWIAWWVVLVAWKLGPAIPVLLRVSGEGAKGSANVSFGDGGFSATISEGATVAWEGHVSFLMLVLLIGVPPLIIWGVWLRSGKRSSSAPLLGEGQADHVGRSSPERAGREQRRQ